MVSLGAESAQGPLPKKNVVFFRPTAANGPQSQQRRASRVITANSRCHACKVWARTVNREPLAGGSLDHLLNDTIDELRQPNPMSRFRQVPFQVGHGRFGRQGVRPRELSQGLNVLLKGAEELISIGDLNRFGCAVPDEPLGLVRYLSRTPSNTL